MNYSDSENSYSYEANKPLTEGQSLWVPTDRISTEDCNRIIDSAKDFRPGTVVLDGKNVESPVRKTKSTFGNEQWVYDLVWPYMLAANLHAHWHFQVDAAEDYQITKYEEGDFYGVHVDSLGTHDSRRIDPSLPNLHNKSRKMSMSLLLNDTYDGGDLNLFSVQPIRKETGTMVFFPSFVPHEVTPVIKGTRYSLVMWFVGRPWY